MFTAWARCSNTSPEQTSPATRWNAIHFGQTNHDNFPTLHFQLKWALDEKLHVASAADVGGLGAALRLVLTHRSLRDKFTGVNRELEEAGFRSIQVTDTGFRLIRDWDTELNPEMAFGEDIDDAFNWRTINDNLVLRAYGHHQPWEGEGQRRISYIDFKWMINILYIG